VVIFVVVKFSEGAWLVVLLFIFGVPALIRLNREYRMEAGVLEHIEARRAGRPPEPPTYSRRTVLVFVDALDLATLAALRYARSLRPTGLRAVHFVIDSAQADTLRQDWVRANTGVVLDFVDCPDRRLARAAAEMVSAEAALPGVGVTAILPRRGYSQLLGRLLHDRTADRIASVVSRIPHSAATIVPFDVRSRVLSLHQRKAAQAEAGVAVAAAAAPGGEPPGTGQPDRGQPDRGQPAGDGQDGKGERTAAGGPVTVPVGGGQDEADYNRPAPPADCTPIGSLTKPGRAVVVGRVHAVEIRPVERSTVLACEIVDSTGQLTALFYGRSHIAGLDPGAKVRLRGLVGRQDGRSIMINPAYELLAPGSDSSPPGR
jgi:hypothetical protein